MESTKTGLDVTFDRIGEKKLFTEIVKLLGYVP